MIIVDPRENNDVMTAASKLGVEIVKADANLDYGDYVFDGYGEFGECMVGCERKKLGDLVNSMTDRRLSGHQLRGLWKCYDYVFLLVEGMFRPGPGGEIEELVWDGRERKNVWRAFYKNGNKGERGAVSYRHVDAYLNSLSLRSRSPRGEPLRVKRSSYHTETAAQLVALYKGFTEKRWDEHHAHDELYAPGPKKGHGGNWAHPHEHNEGFGAGRSAGVGLKQDDPTTVWRMASQLGGIDRRAVKVAQYFKTVRNMDLAGLDPVIRKQVDTWFLAHPESAEQAWQAIDGIGKAIAKAAVRAITEEGA